MLLFSRIPDSRSFPPPLPSVLAQRTAGTCVPQTHRIETREACSRAELDLKRNWRLSTRPDIVACLGGSPETVNLLDQCKFLQHGAQSPYRFDILSARDLMNKSSYSVFGRIDFFSVIQFLVISLGGCLSQDWTLTAPELTKVR